MLLLLQQHTQPNSNPHNNKKAHISKKHKNEYPAIIPVAANCAAIFVALSKLNLEQAHTYYYYCFLPLRVIFVSFSFSLLPLSQFQFHTTDAKAGISIKIIFLFLFYFGNILIKGLDLFWKLLSFEFWFYIYYYYFSFRGGEGLASWSLPFGGEGDD